MMPKKDLAEFCLGGKENFGLSHAEVQVRKFQWRRRIEGEPAKPGTLLLKQMYACVDSRGLLNYRPSESIPNVALVNVSQTDTWVNH